MTNYLRPDEQANLSEIERAESRDSNLKKGIKLATSLSLGSKVLPFLNEYIPADLAMKGISKVAPKVGEFLKKGTASGLNLKDGLDYLKNEFTSQESKKQPAKENRNIIEQYSPELHQFIDEQVKNGRSPLEAGALAQHDKRFSNIISKLSKDHKTPWSGILQTVYGNIQSQQTKQNNQTQQPGQGQAALMSILQKLQQSRGIQ